MQTILQYIKAEDAILWRTRKIMDKAEESPAQLADCQTAVMQLLAKIQNPITRGNYFNTIISKYKWKQRKELQKLMDECTEQKTANPMALPGIDEEIELDDTTKIPAWITPAMQREFFVKGYITAMVKDGKKWKVGYYSLSISRSGEGASYSEIQITNFTIEPLFHIYAGLNSRFLLKVNNGMFEKALDVPAKVIPSVEQFQQYSVSEGNYFIFGNKNQWLRIASDLMNRFPRCSELQDLGYIENGFFAYSDFIYKPGKGKIAVDRYGIFEHGESKYLLPQQCEVYRELQSSSSDPYENDRCLTYKQSPVSFEEWARMIHRVFGIKGTIGVTWMIFCLFRDIIMRTTSTSPHLYLFGPTGSGKSALANALYALFYVERKPFIAYEGTIFAFYAYLSRFVNAPAFINELDASTTDMDRLQTIKGVFDGEGRERGKKEGGKRATEIQKINSGLMLAGQFLVTADDNSIVNRSIVEDFLPNESRTEADVAKFNELDQLGKQGITSLLTDLLEMRSTFDKEFRTNYLERLGRWIRKSADEGKPLVQRIMQNYCMISSCFDLLSKHFRMPVNVMDMEDYCIAQARRWSSFTSASDILSEFWRFLQSMANGGVVQSGWDFDLDAVSELTLRDGQKLTFDEPRMILFIRLTNVHKPYQREYRTRYSKEGMSQENLLHYFSSKKYYVGAVKQKRFQRIIKKPTKAETGSGYFEALVPEATVTSCYAFYYDDIVRQVDGFSLMDDAESFAINPTFKPTTPNPSSTSENAENEFFAKNGDIFENDLF